MAEQASPGTSRSRAEDGAAPNMADYVRTLDAAVAYPLAAQGHDADPSLADQPGKLRPDRPQAAGSDSSSANQAAASSATRSSAPGSSKRWVASGMTSIRWRTAEPGGRLLVQGQDGAVGAADDQQRRRGDALEALPRHVGAAAAGDYRADAAAQRGGGAERGGGARGGAEVGRSGVSRSRDAAPAQRVAATSRSLSSSMSKTLARSHLLLDGEQVEQQGREAAFVESGGDLTVARAEPAGAAAVSEDDQAPGIRGDDEVGRDVNRRGRDLHVALTHLASLRLSSLEPAAQG